MAVAAGGRGIADAAETLGHPRVARAEHHLHGGAACRAGAREGANLIQFRVVCNFGSCLPTRLFLASMSGMCAYDSLSAGVRVPQHLCMPRVEGPEHRGEPADATPVRTRPLPGALFRHAVFRLVTMTQMQRCSHLRQAMQESVLKIAKSQTRSFKCPYCPLETIPSACKRIHFPQLTSA